MYRNVLLTDKEITLLKTLIRTTLSEKISSQNNNLTVIHSRLAGIKPLISNNGVYNCGK